MNKKTLQIIFIALFFVSLNFGFFDMDKHNNIVTLIGFVVALISAMGAILTLDNSSAHH